MRVAFVALILLSACGSSDPAAVENVVAEAPAATPLTAPPELSQPVPVPMQMEIAESMPGTFRARWGLVPVDCEPGRADAKGLMTITATTLTFYESRATIKTASPTPTDGVALTLAFTGEGQDWTVRTVFELTDEGRTLLRHDSDPPMRLRYTRCPA